MPETLVEPELQTTDTGEHDRMRHYFKKADIERAYLYGDVIQAICGKTDVPLRDPDKYPTCPSCKEIYDSFERD